MDRIKRFLYDNGVPEDEANVAVFGLHRFFLTSIGLLASFLIGLLFNDIKAAFLFLLFFIPIRIFAGGLHFSSLLSCGIVSAGIVVISINLIGFLSNTGLSFKYDCLLFLFAILHICIAPQDNSNKRLFKIEKRLFKLMTIGITLLYCFLFFVFKSYGYVYVSTSILISLLISSVSLSGAFFANRKTEKI